MNDDLICSAADTTVTFTVPSVSSQTYNLCDSTLSIDTSAFAIAETCSDESWTYSSEWKLTSDNSVAKSSTTYTGSSYDISETDSSMIDTYDVYLYGTMPDGQQGSTNF
jgi:hypothetical protein